MKDNLKLIKVDSLNKKELKSIEGGGKTWKWLGEITGDIISAIEDSWENWSENCAYNAGMAKC